MTKKQELLDKIEELKKQVEKIELEEKSGRWKPNYGELYYSIYYGRIREFEWANNHTDKGSYDCGLVFKTEEEAEGELMRMKARANRWLPSEGQFFFYYDFDSGEVVERVFFGIGTLPILYYWLGNIHKTEEEAEAWGKKYGKYFEIGGKK